MAVLVKGNIRSVTLTSGHILQPPAAWGIAHDESGSVMDRHLVVVAPYTVSISESVPLTDSERQGVRNYYGIRYNGRRVFVDIPDAAWQRVGDVAQIEYARRGRYEGNMLHRFGVRVALLASSRGARLALVLPEGCVFDERGFVDHG